MKKHSNFIVSILFLAVGFLLFYKLGDSRLLDVDEPRYAEAAREMLESGNWLTPYFNYELRFDKPVFYYWTIAWSYIVFGVNEFAARFSSAVAGLLTVFMTFLFADKAFNRRTAIYSSLILATMLEFLVISRMSITDSMLSFFIVSAIITAYFGVEQEKHNKFYWWLSYIFCGLGVLTKGPVAFVLPAGIIGLYLLLTKQFKNNLKLSYHLPGIVLFLGIALPWYILMIKTHGQLYIDEFFIKHNISRFSGEGFHHRQPFWFFVPVILIGIFPWTFYLISNVMLNLFQHLSNLGFKHKSEADKTPKQVRGDVYLIIWALAVFMFYSASKAKLPTYIMPIFPALAVFIGALWADFTNNYKLIKIPTLIWAVPFLTAGIIAVSVVNIPHWQAYLSILFIIIPVLLIFSVIQKREIVSFALIVTFMAGTLLVRLNIVDPIIYNLAQKDFKHYINIAHKYKNAEIYTWQFYKPSLTFYSRQKVVEIRDIKDVLPSDNPVFIITKQNKKYNLITNIKEIEQ